MSVFSGFSPTPCSSSITLRSLGALAALVITCALAAPEAAQAASTPGHKPSTSKATSKKGAAKPPQRNGSSEETRAERERRLFRECRGMPNAGACKGFTRR